jgi:hypothetical protein
MGLSPGTPEHLDTAWALFFWTHLTQYSNNVCKRWLRSDSRMDGYSVASARVCLSTHSVSACCHLRSMAEPINRYGDFSVGQCDGANTSGHLGRQSGDGNLGTSMISKSQEETEVSWHLGIPGQTESPHTAYVRAAAQRPNPSIHHGISAIEFILKHLAPKSLRDRAPSDSLFSGSGAVHHYLFSIDLVLE